MNTQTDLGLPSVLVVDDEPAILKVVSRILQAEYTVVTKTSADGALASLDEGAQYVTVVCDLTMPNTSGLDLLRQVRERDSEMPVIILTGNGSLESAMAVIQHGGFRYLTKPFTEEGILEAVRAASATRQVELLRRRAVEICDSGAWKINTHSELDGYFDEALANLFMAFQPIVHHSSESTFGFEALLRSKGPKLTNPLLLLGAAERLGRVRDLGREVRRLVAKEIPLAPKQATIFVNLHSLDLGDDDLFAESAPLSQAAGRVVLEITERMSLDSIADLNERIGTLRRMGYRIAVDDLGAGYAGLTSFSELSPDIVKLDMSLIRDLNTSERKRSIVNSLLTVCQRDLSTRVVCEGVETRGELNTLSDMGADLLQGYLFGRPAANFSAGEFAPASE